MKEKVRIFLDRLGDKFLGVDTVSSYGQRVLEKARFGDVQPHQSPLYLHLVWFLTRMPTTPQDVWWDIGCGCGRVLCLAARRRLKLCVGAEISAELAEKARANLHGLRGRRCPVEIRVGDAAEADFTTGTVFYLFNPFGVQTLGAVLERIKHSLSHNARRVRFIYVNPVHAEMFDSARWLRSTFLTSPPGSRSVARGWENA